MREWVIAHSMMAYQFLAPISGIALAVVVFALLPLAAWRGTRGWAGVGLFIFSYLFGATAWFLGAAATFGSFGWFGLIVGVFFFGIGVVPLGIIGAYFKLDASGLALNLLVMITITFVARFGGAYLASRVEERAPAI